MAFRVVACHYPTPENRREMVERIKRAAEVMAGRSGFVAADCWLEEAGGAVVAAGTFESKEHWMQAMRAVARAEVDFDFDERESQPRSVQLLHEA